jgi:hypothetical protein
MMLTARQDKKADGHYDSEAINMGWHQLDSHQTEVVMSLGPSFSPKSIDTMLI